VEITAIDGSQLEVLQDFKYLGSMMSSTEAGSTYRARKGIVWRANLLIAKYRNVAG